MSPTVPPESGDFDMWNMIFNALRQMLLTALLWAQINGPILALGAFAAWLFGMKRGLKGTSLKVAVGSGMLFTYVFTPLALHYFGLVEELWKAPVVVFLAVSSWRVVQWLEDLLLRNLGIERRNDSVKRDSTGD